MAVERSQRRRQARAVVGLVAREAAALAFPGHARADRCDQRRHDLDIDLAEDGEAARVDRLWIDSGSRARRGGEILNLPLDAAVVLLEEIDAGTAFQSAVPGVDGMAQLLAELAVVLLAEPRRSDQIGRAPGG